MAYRPRPPEPPKKRPLLSKWTILLVVLGAGFALFWHDPKLKQWAVGKAKPFFLPVPIASTEPPPPAPVAATPVFYPPPPPPAAAALPKDECSPWGHDAAAYRACEDHKQKVQATIEAKIARDKAFNKPKPTEEDGTAATTDASAEKK
jgi:hypothetical protein